MTREEFVEIATQHLDQIRESYEELIKSSGSKVVQDQWDAGSDALLISIRKDRFDLLGLIDLYEIDGVEVNVKLVDYHSIYGHYESKLSKYVEEIENFDDMIPIKKESDSNS